VTSAHQNCDDQETGMRAQYDVKTKIAAKGKLIRSITPSG